MKRMLKLIFPPKKGMRRGKYDTGVMKSWSCVVYIIKIHILNNRWSNPKYWWQSGKGRSPKNN